MTDAVTRRGGVARVATLQRDGHSRYRITEAVRAGWLIRVRRDWVALPSADAELVAAAHRGVVLSCVTLARRKGLWVLDEDRPHVAAAPHAAVPKATQATVHWSAPVVPRHPEVLEDHLENALALVAVCQPHEAARAIWESALRKGLIDAPSLARLPFSGRARRVLADVVITSDSGLETLFLTRLRWLRLRILAQVWIEGHPVDFLIGDRLVVQIDGGHHVGVQRTKDIEHDARLMLLGYHVIRIGYVQIVHDWASVHDLIVRAVGQGLHLAT